MIGAVHLAGTLINAGTVLVGTAIGTLAGAIIGGLSASMTGRPGWGRP